MGCIPSKQSVLEADGMHSSKAQSWKEKRARRKERTRAKRDRALASPVVEGDAPPWVSGHAVLTQKNGEYRIMEGKS